jgi:hypothetical protein
MGDNNVALVHFVDNSPLLLLEDNSFDYHINTEILEELDYK